MKLTPLKSRIQTEAPARLAVMQPGSSPDGMTVDSEGAPWIAQWGGGRMCRYLLDGTRDATVVPPIRSPPPAHSAAPICAPCS